MGTASPSTVRRVPSSRTRSISQLRTGRPLAPALCMGSLDGGISLPSFIIRKDGGPWPSGWDFERLVPYGSRRSS